MGDFGAISSPHVPIDIWVKAKQKSTTGQHAIGVWSKKKGDWGGGGGGGGGGVGGGGGGGWGWGGGGGGGGGGGIDILSIQMNLWQRIPLIVRKSTFVQVMGWCRHEDMCHTPLTVLSPAGGAV